MKRGESKPPGANDAALFRDAVRDAVPLRTRTPIAARPMPTMHTANQPRKPAKTGAAIHSLPSAAEYPLELGEELNFIRQGLGRDVLRKLRRGTWPMGDELDLQGMTRETARREFAVFMQDCRERGSRCVRIIHGKGLSSSGNAPVLKAGGKTLVTTLTCPKHTSKADLRSLYRSRWHVELDLRNIKTTLGMDRLSCQTPAMAIKEIWVYLLAYNLIRLMMAQAALLALRLPRQLSFKHTVQIWIAWHHHPNQIDNDNKLHCVFVLIAQQSVAERPGRIEPRAIKRRPKPYPLLTKPRAILREYVRKHGHPQELK
ncbi:MAG: hypothetical protein EXR27_19865 [Betaproteobacteria bacterium]|nr:hypothetical protein [Betaproteobacteria bacterium]